MSIRRCAWLALRQRRPGGWPWSGGLHGRAYPAGRRPLTGRVPAGPGSRARPGLLQPYGQRLDPRPEPHHHGHLHHVRGRQRGKHPADPGPLLRREPWPEALDTPERLFGRPGHDLARRPGPGQGFGQDLREMALPAGRRPREDGRRPPPPVARGSVVRWSAACWPVVRWPAAVTGRPFRTARRPGRRPAAAAAARLRTARRPGGERLPARFPGGNVLVVRRGRLRNQEHLDRCRVGKRSDPAWCLWASRPFGGHCGHGNLP